MTSTSRNTSTEEISTRVMAALAEVIPEQSETKSAIDINQSIGAGGLGISSLALLKVFVRLEVELGFMFEDVAVANATFSTVSDIVGFIADTVERRHALAGGQS